MPTGPQVTLALGVGYVLGRKPRRKLAVMLGTAALAGGASGAAGQVMRRGVKMAASSLGSTEALSKVAPGLGEITGIIRGDLIDAAKAAGMAAVNSRIDSMSDQLRDRAETLRNPTSEAGDLVGRVIDDEDTGSGDDERSPAAARGTAAAARPQRAVRSAAGNGRRTSGQARRSTGDGRRSTGDAGRTTGQARRSTGDAGRTGSGGVPPARPRRRSAQQAGSPPPVRRASRTTSQGR